MSEQHNGVQNEKDFKASNQADNQDTDSGGFSEHWLSLREPADHQARSRALTLQAKTWAHSIDSLSILELGAGTGSNLRYLCPLLGHNQHWTLIDDDTRLLEQLPRLLGDWAPANDISINVTTDSVVLENDAFSATVTWIKEDLATRLEQLDWASTDLVSASALLDLTSQGWLTRLATLCSRHRCAAFFVLNYDGRIQWIDAHEHDASITRLLNAHQLSDKGFGPALGPLAGQRIAELLHGSHKVSIQPSDWHIGTDQQALQQALIDGWAPAAEEQDLHSHKADIVRQWHTHRTQVIKLGQSELVVGHSDVLALPF